MRPVSEIGETVVVPLIVDIMLTVLTAIDVGVLAMIAETIVAEDIADSPQSKGM